MKRCGVEMKRVVDILAAAVALTGFVLSLYLILDHYGLTGQQPALLSQACPLEEGACAVVTESPSNTIFGIPYPILGGLYFLALFAVSLVKLYKGKWPVPRILTVFISGGLVFSLYLTYTMFEVIREVCPYCLATHTANAAFCIFYIASLHKELDDTARHRVQAVFQQ